MIEILRRAWSAARELLQRRRLRDELDEEVRFHLDAEIAHNLARGMTPGEARRMALVAFGGVHRFREETNDARGFAAVEGLLRDLRLAARRLRRAPAFTAGVIGTLAIALGAATGVSALVYGVLLRPLPYPDADRLTQLAVLTPGLNLATTEHSAGTYRFVAEEARSFASVGGYSLNEGITITDGDEPERVAGANLTPSLLHMLGVVPLAGRLFVEEDARADTTGVIISESLWRRRFGADPTIAGQTIELSRRRRVILGVVSASAEAPWNRVSVYFPEEVVTSSPGLNSRYLTVIGRLAPDATVESAQRELDALAVRFPERYPQVSAQQLREAGFRMTVTGLHDAMVAPVRGELRLLAIMIAALLLIAVANVGTLALLRAERLKGEVAVSRALGATGGAIVRRFVTEGALLALGGGLVALPCAALALSARFGFTAAEIPRLHDLRVTPALAVALAAMALGIGVLLGLVAAARADGGAAGQSLRADTRTTPGRGWRRVQAGLVTIQVAFSLALLLGAGVMGMSLIRLQRVDLGFASTERATFALRLPWTGYATWEQVAGFHTRLEETLRAMPGVTAAATAMHLPSTPQLLYLNPRLDVTRRDGRTTQAFVSLNIVSPAFFAVMEVPILAGRGFDATDLATPEPGVMLSASLARELFGEEDPIGRQVVLASGGRFPPYRVVGVSGDVYSDRVADGALRTLYLPLVPRLLEGIEMPVVPAGVQFVARSERSLADLGPLFRAAVSSIDARIPLWGVQTLERIVADTMARTRLTMVLLGVAAVATLLLSAMGLYSVIAYAVTARTREFAVRLALGSTPGAVAQLVLREGALVAGLGVVLGIALSLAGTRLLQSVLFEVSATDPRLYLAGTVLVLAAMGIALLVPARRAGSSDPAGALRGE